MSKKLTKTIILIVFVVFLGINKVEAAEPKPFVVCYYRNSSDVTKTINVTIMNDDFNTITAQASDSIKSNQTIGKPAANWSEATASKSYKKKVGTGSANAASYGINYFKANSLYRCPPVLYYVQFAMTTAIYFGTDNEKENEFIKSATQEDRNDWDKLIHNERTPIEYSYINQKFAKDDETSLAAKQCACSGTAGGKSINAGFTVTPDLTEPEIVVDSTIYSGDASNEDNVHNWSKVPEELTDTEHAKDFTFAAYYQETSACPQHLIIAKSGSRNRYYFAGDFNGHKGRDIADDIADKLPKVYSGMSTYVLSCKEGTININSNSNSNGNGSTSNNSDSNDSDQNAEITNNVGSLEDNNTTYSCGSGFVTGIPYKIISLTKIAYNFIQFLVPLIVIILGILDLIKAISSQKEDEIKKGQSIFFKRLITAVFVFFIFAIIKLVVSVASDASKSEGIIGCMECFLKGDGCASEGTSNENEDA